MSAEDAPDRHVIDIFMMSVKCGNCDSYKTIVKFRKGPEKNVYNYECEDEICLLQRRVPDEMGSKAPVLRVVKMAVVERPKVALDKLR